MRISPLNVGSFLASAVAAQAAAVVAGLLLVRWMSVADYALYTIGITIVGAITLLTRGGVRLGLAAALAEAWPDRKAAAGAVDAAMRVRLLVSALTMPPILGFAWFLLDRAGASTFLSFSILGILAAVWLADTYGAVIDQVLFFDRKAVRLQTLDGAIAWVRLIIIVLLRFAGAVSAVTALATNLFASLSRAPLVRHWIRQSLEGHSDVAGPETVNAVRRVALRQIPVDVFVALQTQATIYYLTLGGGGLELATYGAVSRIAQLLNPFNALILAYFVPHFAKASDRIVTRILGYVAIGALPGAGLFVLSLLAPQALLFFIGPAYSGQTWPLLVCAGMVAVVTAVEVAVSLIAHRGWNRWGWVRILIGLIWIAMAPEIVPVHTAAGAYLFFCGFSFGTVIALGLELRSAHLAGEIRLGRASPSGV